MTAPHNINTPWMTREEAAAYCRLSKKTLENYATNNAGPPYWNPTGSPVGGGRVRYHREALDRWMQGDLSRQGLQPPPSAAAKRAACGSRDTRSVAVFFDAVALELSDGWAFPPR
jgi:hypothetical protein